MTPRTPGGAQDEGHRRTKTKATGVRLTGEDARELHKRAAEKGVAAGTLLRMWAREHLRPQR